MRSGPGALSGFRPCNNLIMPFTEMHFFHITVCVLKVNGDIFWAVVSSVL